MIIIPPQKELEGFNIPQFIENICIEGHVLLHLNTQNLNNKSKTKKSSLKD
jgi:hypothetical protein